MRRLGQRPALRKSTRDKLAEKHQEVLAVPQGDQRKQHARDVYKAARGAQWFEPVVKNLRSLCGKGELCMYCSSNEPSQVEHFRPLSAFPEKAFEYANYLWTCDICNRDYKGNRFPPDTEPGAPILNPLEDNVWEHFFLEPQFGRLICRMDPSTRKPLPRAQSTCAVVGINRENVQIKRQSRFASLKRQVERLLVEHKAGTASVQGLRAELALLRSEPFQADVADYFLNGPGRSKQPFKELLELAGEKVP